MEPPLLGTQVIWTGVFLLSIDPGMRWSALQRNYKVPVKASVWNLCCLKRMQYFPSKELLTPWIPGTTQTPVTECPYFQLWTSRLPACYFKNLSLRQASACARHLQHALETCLWGPRLGTALVGALHGHDNKMPRVSLATLSKQTHKTFLANCKFCFAELKKGVLKKDSFIRWNVLRRGVSWQKLAWLPPMNWNLCKTSKAGLGRV